ncbi:MAG: hypothetical protein J3Q66DRAFT_369540 [Benniella sp.]|nr:MAG: hypothetical protein J3Q66DRAFT_369540 [Benniella sp.]
MAISSWVIFGDGCKLLVFSAADELGCRRQIDNPIFGYVKRPDPILEVHLEQVVNIDRVLDPTVPLTQGRKQDPHPPILRFLALAEPVDVANVARDGGGVISTDPALNSLIICELWCSSCSPADVLDITILEMLINQIQAISERHRPRYKSMRPSSCVKDVMQFIRIQHIEPRVVAVNNRCSANSQGNNKSLSSKKQSGADGSFRIAEYEIEGQEEVLIQEESKWTRRVAAYDECENDGELRSCPCS